MVARSVVTLGVSTERGAVHAVVLADSGEQLPERVLMHRVARPRGDSKADVAAAVEAAMDEVAAEIGPRQWIAGTAVVYRDAAERRAIVTRLASGPWHSTSMVSTKSAHLSLAGMMSRLDRYDHLLICEIVPGYQSFTLVDRNRSRVLAATSQSGVATTDSLAIAVTAAWDQLEAAAAKPDAVVLIGSAADGEVVREALAGFGAPVLPCPIAIAAPAAGAAMSAMSDVPGMEDTIDSSEEPMRYGRGTAALLAAAGVLACGMIAGGVYTIDSMTTTDTAAVVETHPITDVRRPAEDTAARKPATAPLPGFDAGRAPVVLTPEPRFGDFTPSTIDTGVSTPRFAPRGAHALPLDQSTPTRGAEEVPAALLPGAGVPESTKVGAPDGSMLFPGETPPPAAFTPEAQHWWDNHFRLLMQWASEQFTADQTVTDPPAPDAAVPAPTSPAPGGVDQAPARSEQSTLEQRTAIHTASGRHAAGRHAAAV
ncbi:hypothetical protein [Nocardia bovistercoris]|uniref:DUF7159 domain-containing protein n=1 Tax=Nocardia bovistercoris TaxID=2785916 RepID=A0A931IBX9_9NOCA|nr:hypothetical protein [Nocardia bovistercoris]MBH0777025.1 hypothetical protein [Nocardia bovistercoris]